MMLSSILRSPTAQAVARRTMASASKPKVLFTGLRADVVDYERWKHLDMTPEKLNKALAAEMKSVEALGCEVIECSIDTGETAEKVMREALSAGDFDIVLIGAGVRKDDTHFMLFEKAVNAAHELAPKAKIVFNESPNTSADAVKRWLNKK